jgi:hypothetical protein
MASIPAEQQQSNLLQAQAAQVQQQTNYQTWLNAYKMHQLAATSSNALAPASPDMDSLGGVA